MGMEPNLATRLSYSRIEYLLRICSICLIGGVNKPKSSPVVAPLSASARSTVSVAMFPTNHRLQTDTRQVL